MDYIDYVNYTDYVIYTFLFVCIILLCVFAYIKIKYPFWNAQPVFHVYDFHYMLFPPGIICSQLPEKNKYTNFKKIITHNTIELSEIKINNIVSLIQNHYLREKENIYYPKKQHVMPYFYGHNSNSYFSLYYENKLLHDVKTQSVVEDKNIIGVITSRPIHVVINEKYKYKNSKNAMFDAYYVDFLCVHTNYRKKGIAQQLIQTHHYNQRHANKKIVVSLFKRENELTGIVPLCTYFTYGFSVNKWTRPLDLPENLDYKLLEITPQNSHVLFDFIKSQENEKVFDIFIYTEFANIIELIKSKNIFVYVLLSNQHAVCAYFYRASRTFVDKNMEVLCCFASIKGKEIEYRNDIFIHGFKISFWKIAEKNGFGFASIENISHNNILIDNLLLKNTPVVMSPTAYFFYNFAYLSFPSEKTFILL